MSLGGMKIAVLATDGVEQSELTEPMQALEEAGAEVVLISIREGQIQGYHRDRDKADKFDVDYHITDVQADDYDGVMLPGGKQNADEMRRNGEVLMFLRRADQAGKPFAAICHAPWEMAAAGLVAGRTLTSYPKIQNDIRDAGGTWEDREVVTDDNWVTSRRPGDLEAFNRAMLRLFADYRKKAGLIDPFAQTQHQGASHPGMEVRDESGSRP